MNIEVGFTADLVARNKMAPFIFAVNQYITEFEILHENDGCGVVHDVLQSLFAITQRLLGPLALLLRAERCNAIRQVVRQVRVLLNGALIKGIGLFGIKTKTANTFSVSDQRKRNARSITARNCGGSPRSQAGFGSDVFDPAGFAGSEGDARRTPASCRFFAPGNSGIFQVIESVSRLCHRANSFFKVVFAAANPGQTKPSHFHQNLADGLKELIFIRGVNERVVALIKSLEDAVQPAELLLAGTDRIFGLLSIGSFFASCQLVYRLIDDALQTPTRRHTDTPIRFPYPAHGSYPILTSPRPEAIAIASVRPIAFSFFNIDFTWFFTVYSLM